MDEDFKLDWVRGLTERYLDHEIDVDRFEDAFISYTWNVDTRERTLLAHTVNFVTLSLADYKDGELTEGELRLKLTSLRSRVEYDQLQVTITSSTAATID